MKKLPQKYALDETNNLVHIDDADDSHVYRCLVCKKEMITKNKLDSKRRKRTTHFAHDKNECDYENYLHSLAEIKICEWFNKQKSIQLFLEHRVSCSKFGTCSMPKDSSCTKMEPFFDLKKYFRSFDIEKKQVIGDDFFIPDILSLYETDKGNIIPLFIEINVTHKCEEKKINSGIRIIEFTIKSEYDIENFVNKSEIMPKEGKVKLYNFNPQEERSNDFSVPIVKYIMNPITELIEVKECTCKEDRKGIFEVSFKKNELYRIKDREMLIFDYFKAKIFDDIYSFRNCVICKRKAPGEPFLCLESKYWDIPGHNAKNCKDFEPDNMKYKELADYINTLQNYLQVWKDPNWK